MTAQMARPVDVPIDVCAVGVLRHLRLDAQLSIRELELASGVNRGRLSSIERGTPATTDELHAILDAIYAKRSSLDARELVVSARSARWTHRHDD
jgi:transcriptional regulator with XRE-family HTH domain